MKTKTSSRHGEHEYTTIKAEWNGESKEGIVRDQLEHSIAVEHERLREQIQTAIRYLKDADARLETNLTKDDWTVATLLRGVNSLGVLQGQALEIDGGIRRLSALVDAFTLLYGRE